MMSHYVWPENQPLKRATLTNAGIILAVLILVVGAAQARYGLLTNKGYLNALYPAYSVRSERLDAVKPIFTWPSFNRVTIIETDFPSPEQRLSPGWAVGKPVPATFLTALDNSNRVTLSAAEADTLFRRLVSPKSYRYGASICFVPRLAIFFLKGDTLVNHVAVCLECNRLKSDVYIKPAAWSKNSLNPKGMSVAMRRYLSALIARHGFKHGIDGNSVWDSD